MIKFFVAASWFDKDKASDMAYIISMRYGWQCTSYWWKHEDPKHRLSYAIEDLKNLREADYLFVYNGEHKTTGKLIEIGVALGLGIPVFVYGNKISGVYSELIIYKGEKL